MAELREALQGGPNHLNWFLLYGAQAGEAAREGWDRIEFLGREGGPKQVWIEGYVLMPRVAGCSRVHELAIEDRKDLIWVAECAREQIVVTAEEQLHLATHVDYLRLAEARNYA